MTNNLLKKSGLLLKTDGLIIAAKFQGLLTKNYLACIRKNGPSPLSRL